MQNLGLCLGYLIKISRENPKNLTFFTNVSNKLGNFGTHTTRSRRREEIKRIQVARKYFVLSGPLSLILKVAQESSP